MGMGRGERPARRLGVLAVYAVHAVYAAGWSAVRVGRARLYARLCAVEHDAAEPLVPRPRSTPVALAVLAVVGVAACSSTASSAAPPTPTAPSACAASQLHVDVKPLPGAATGRTFMDVVLTDKSASSCTLTGSVQLTVADAAHHQIPVPSTVFPGSGAATVTVHPGGSAAEAVVYNSDGNPAPGQAVCAPPVAFYDITAPGTTTAVSVPIAGRLVCPHDSLTLSNLVPGDYSPPF